MNLEMKGCIFTVRLNFNIYATMGSLLFNDLFYNARGSPVLNFIEHEEYYDDTKIGFFVDYTESNDMNKTALLLQFSE